ncbi:MAG: stealth conserved region 3 domain-containing protein [Candidatus Nanopelagicales bacterium]
MVARPGVQATVEAWTRQSIEPLKRRVRASGPDPMTEQRRARAREPVFDQPIDAVITWVDDADPQWRADREAALARKPAGSAARDASTDARFRTLGELRYVLRGIDQFMPWVRRVVLVTSGQAPPAWLDPDSVRVVAHADFLAPTALPTFNSHAIESALWRIDGLAEHFVYFNDDVLVTRGVRPNDFFSPTGWPRVCVTALPVPGDPGPALDSAALSGARNARRVLASSGVGEATRLVAHTPNAQRRSLHRELAGDYPGPLSRTEHSPFRTAEDVAPIFLHTWFALLTGRAEEVLMTHRYVELSTARGSRRLEMEVRRRDVDFLCANLAADPLVPWPRLASRVDAALAVALPGRSRFER